MAASKTEGLTQHLRRIVFRTDGVGMPDGQLLEAFISHRDAAAFEALVRRHGPMVLGVCRRILRDPHDAEDAFQATFLVLARKAASVSPREMVGNFLYGVAHTTAIRARAANTKRRSRERPMRNLPEPEVVPTDLQDDLQQFLDDELARLPDKYRVPIVLCDLQGRTRRDVARQLQIPEGTLSSRLSTARRLLAKRLARNGLAVSGGALAAALSPSAASASVPGALAKVTAQAALLVVAGQTATGLISVPVAALAEGVLKAMFLTKLKSITGVMLVVASLCGAAGLIYPMQAAEQTRTPRAIETAAKETRPIAKNQEKPQPEKRRKPEDDRVAIQGDWQVIAVQHSDEVEAEQQARRCMGGWWRIRADNIDIRGEGMTIGLCYKLHPSRSPKILDFMLLGHPIPAIYALEGDVLQIRMNVDFHEQIRPKSLTAEEGDKTMLVILKREHPKATRVPEKAGKEDRPEPKKTEETAASKSVESIGHIKIKTGPQEYKTLFIKMLGVMAGRFEQIIYANQYDGRIEAYKIGPLTNRLSVQEYGFVRHAVVLFRACDDGYLITVRINKIRMLETNSEEVVGRDTELEKVILTKLNARQVSRDSLPAEVPPAPPKAKD